VFMTSNDGSAPTVSASVLSVDNSKSFQCNEMSG